MLAALRIRDFRLLWFARLISLLGSWLLVVAIPAYVLQLTGSLAATGLTLAAEFLPPVLLGPVAGVLADRWDRRKLMIATDVLRALAVALLLLVRDPGDVWLVYLALVAESVGTVLFRPAAQAHTPVVVGTGPALTSANSLNAITDGTVRLVGAPLGGALFGVAGLGALVWIDLATYLMSALAIVMTARLGAADAREEGSSGRFFAQLREGVIFLRTERSAAWLLAVVTVFLAANASLSALLVPFGVRVLGGSMQTGLLMSGLGAGFLVGAPLIRRLVDRMPPAYLLGGALMATGTAFVLLFLSRSLVAALPAAVLIGVVGSAALVTAQTALQRITPNAVLGRVSAVQFTGEALATFLGAIAGPAIAEAVSLDFAAYLACGVTVLSGLMALVLLPRTRVVTAPP
ncbi:Predicted arabinose efflux permease, MFS family [Lentzea xinjiangensis]|uniref:Predicted arabinose efflux permease, MFS family n=1 Tax=Lentzea xinjiangensis TaxID=402600 RepID=A0A1H9W372_9PSEU|nr:Predicted arabinose efflux permease, MFS family [Lentzea xinjiangensis]